MGLNAPVSSRDCAAIASSIQQSMIGPWRFFHTLEHGMQVGGNTDPIEMLAGAFHDVVYVQVKT